MSKRIVEKGSDSDIIEALTGALYGSAAIDPTKVDAFRRLFSVQMMDSPGGRKNPEAYGRHMGRILGKLFKDPTPQIAVDVQPARTGMADFEDLLGDDFTATNEVAAETALLEHELETALDEWALAPKHPFIRHIGIAGQRYAIVGTATVRNPEATWNLGCTTGNFAKLKDADEGVLVHRNGRPVTKSKDVGSSSYFTWLVHFKVARSIRFWANYAPKNGPRQDNPAGSKRITMVDETPYFRVV